MSKRKHAEEIKKWAENKDAVVWRFDCEWWCGKGCPQWFEKYDYKTILPEYAELWQAFLDDELQVADPDNYGVVWVDWCEHPPAFDLPPDHYRRRPKPKNIYVVEDDNGHPWCSYIDKEAAVKHYGEKSGNYRPIYRYVQKEMVTDE